MNPNILVLAALGFLLLFQSGCTLSISHDSEVHQVRVPRSRATREELELTLARWDEPVADSSPIHGSWRGSSKWLRSVTTHPDQSAQLRFRSQIAEQRSFDYTTFVESAQVFQVVRAPEDRANGVVEIEAQFATARLLFHGNREGDELAGGFEILPNADFIQRGRARLAGVLTVGELLRFGLQKEPLEYIEAVSAHDDRWTWSEVLHLRQRGLSPEFIAALRKPPTGVASRGRDERRHGARQPFTAHDLVLLHSRGVPVDYVEALDACGTSFEANQIVLLHSRGVPVDFVRAVASSNLAADANDLVLLWSRGVPAPFIREIQESGYNFNANDLVVLHSRGVPGAFARELKRAGYDYSSNDLVMLHSRGVPASYALEVANLNYQPLAATELIRLHSTGVPAETVKRLRK